MKITEGEYKGYPVIKLSMTVMNADGEEFDTYVSFGLKKAKMVLAGMDDIKAFVEKNDKPKDEGDVPF